MQRVSTRVLLGLSSLVGLSSLAAACGEGKGEDLEEARARVEEATQKVAEGVDAARPYAEAARPYAERAGEAMAEGAEVARPYAEKAASATRGWLDEQLPSSGELSASARAWLRETAGDEATESAEAWVLRGKQMTDAAREVGSTLNAAVDRDWACEPVIQHVDDASARRQLDEVIDDMPRVEVIDGLAVGFKSIGGQTATGTERDRGLLVLWRRDDHLYGFVLRARRKIDVETLVRQMPRLIRIMEASVG